MRELAGAMSEVAGVVAVARGSSAAAVREGRGEREFAVYYRGEFRVDGVRALGLEGTVGQPGELGRILNGGARLVIDGKRVCLLYRDLDMVEHWLSESEAGRFEIDRVDGYVAGLPTYVLVGELATCELLSGELPRPSFPERLRVLAPPRWRALAACDLKVAEAAAERGDVATCVGLLAQAAIAEAHARLAERGEWVLNESAITRRAGLGTKVASTLAAPGDRPFELHRSVSAMRLVLRAPEPSS